ncbi:MAG: hypothetical protein ACKV2U_04115 [Bryobacteraceae bacterium]
MHIEQIFYGITTAITLVLTVLTLQRLLSGWWRQYYLLGVILVLVLVAVVPPVASYASNGNWTLSSAQKLYWIQALAFQLAMLLLVLQLIYRVGRETPAQATLVRLLTLASIAAALISVFLHFDNRPNMFMASVTRDLTFLAAILNLVLWRFLLQLRKRDFLVLAVSAGLGIQCTGDTIGHTFRILARQAGSAGALYEIGNILMSLAAVMTIAIWHTAFSRSKYRVEGKAGS